MFDKILSQFSMRGALAGLFSVTTCYLWATGATVPTDLLVVNTLVVGFYFGRYGTVPEPPKEAPLAKPYIPGNEQA